MFKVGDKIVRKKEKIDHVYSDDGYDGRVLIVTSCTDVTVHYSFNGNTRKSSGDTCKFELYKEPSCLIGNKDWYIDIKNMSNEKRVIVTEWLHEQGLVWISGLPRSYFLASTCENIKLDEGNVICTGHLVGDKKEIKFYFNLALDNVIIPEFPAKETETQKKMKELEDKQRDLAISAKAIAEELAKLRESM